MKRAVKVTLSLLIVLAFSTNIYANGLSLNSVGTKALGMGGAFVALSNDATAIYWNPAGLAGQNSSIQLYFTGVMPLGSYDYAPANVSVETEPNLYPTGGLMGVYRMDNLTFALGVYVPSGLGAEYDGSKLAAFAGGANLNWRSRIGVITISPAIAYQVTDQFSIGLGIDISYGLFDLDRAVAVPGVGAFQYTEESTGLGFGATLGLKYDINDQFAVGLSVRTPSKIAMSGTAKNPAFAGFGAPETDFDRDVTWPLWIAGGIAYKPTKCLTLVLDAQYSQWSELDELVTEFDNAVWKGATEPTGDNKFILQWEDAVQIRFGGEYMVTPMTALRLGYYYDPAPAPDKTLNILFPSSTNHVVTGGFGYSFDKYTIEAGLEYLIGADREVTPAEHNMPGVHHLDVFAFSLGFSMGL